MFVEIEMKFANRENAMSEKKQLKPGTIFLGKYKIIDKFSTGSLGDDIYSAEDFQLKRPVSVRILPPDIMEDEDLVQRFVQEIKITVALQHPNILTAFEAGEHNGAHYLVTASVDGSYLNDYIRRYGIFDEEDAVKIILPLIDALKYAWERDNILHRNIRPETILISKDGRPLLTDFGMAKTLSSKRKNKPVTVAGYAIGDPAYMSPEQLKGIPDLDFRADMYCLGLVFHQMLTGQALFQDLPRQEIVNLQLNKKPIPAHKTLPSISEECSNVIDKMLEKERSKRYQTWDELTEDLRAVAAGETPPSFDLEAQKLKKKKGSSSIIQILGESLDPQNVSPTNKNLKITLNIIALAVLAAIVIGAVIFLVASLFSSGDDGNVTEEVELIQAPADAEVTATQDEERRGRMYDAIAVRLLRGEFSEALEEYQASPLKKLDPKAAALLETLAGCEETILNTFRSEQDKKIDVVFTRGERKVAVKGVKNGMIYCLWRKPGGETGKMKFNVDDLAISERMKRLPNLDEAAKSAYVGIAQLKAGRRKSAEQAFQRAGVWGKALMSAMNSPHTAQ